MLVLLAEKTHLVGAAMRHFFYASLQTSLTSRPLHPDILPRRIAFCLRLGYLSRPLWYTDDW